MISKVPIAQGDLLFEAPAPMAKPAKYSMLARSHLCTLWLKKQETRWHGHVHRARAKMPGRERERERVGEDPEAKTSKQTSCIRSFEWAATSTRSKGPQRTCTLVMPPRKPRGVNNPISPTRAGRRSPGAGSPCSHSPNERKKERASPNGRLCWARGRPPCKGPA